MPSVNFSASAIARRVDALLASDRPIVVPIPSCTRDLIGYKLACAMLTDLQSRGALPIGHIGYIERGTCYSHEPYPGPMPALPCPLTTRAMPASAHWTPPPGYCAVDMMTVVRSVVRGGSQLLLSAWTHGLQIEVVGRVDSDEISAAISAAVGDYPVSVTRTDNGAFIQWLDPSAPGSITHAWYWSVTVMR